MIAVARNMKTPEDRFLEMLPKIHEQAATLSAVCRPRSGRS
jgi:hypothetical protein